MSEVNELDELENQYNSLQEEPQEEQLEVEEEVQEETQEETQEVEDKFMSYDQWVADGRDPDLYKGKKAYEDSKSTYESNRELKNELKATNEMFKTTMGSIEEWKAQQISDSKAELEAAIAQARENDDLDAAVDATNKLNDLNQAPVPQQPQQPQQRKPVIEDFLRSNPVLDESSSQYNADVFADMAQLQRVGVDNMSKQGGDDLTEAQLKRIITKAFNDAKSLHSEVFKSSKSSQRAPSGSRKVAAQPKRDLGSDMKSIKLNTERTARNSRNVNAASDIYEMIKEKDPEAAERFAKQANKIVGN